ncbi:MAG: carboxylate--amine ligase [Tissierellia bacterium]|nr:carboxylate--amine ligase [Tissierellia bacterium]
MKNKAVVLGTNYYIGLSITRCLGIHNIPVVGIDYSKDRNYGFYSKYLSEKLIAPNCKEDPEGLLEFLIEYGKKQDKPPVLYPSADGYAEFIDEYLPILRKYYLINQVEQGLFTEVINKESLYSLAREHDILIPETVYIEDENFEEKINSIIKFPCLVKPTDSPSFVSHFRKKLFIVNNMGELKEAISKAQEANLDVVVQRIIPGFDDHMYTFDAYLDQNSKVSHWITCQKLRQFPINYGASVYTIHKQVPELYEMGAKFLEDIGFKGFAEIEFKKDQDSGKYYLIEINARTTNLNSLIHKVGINMPYLAYCELTDKLTEPYTVEEDTNIAFWYAYEDFFAIRDYKRTKQLGRKEIIKSFNRKKAYAIWDIKDPLPFFAFIFQKAKGLFRKIYKR